MAATALVLDAVLAVFGFEPAAELRYVVHLIQFVEHLSFEEFELELEL